MPFIKVLDVARFEQLTKGVLLRNGIKPNERGEYVLNLADSEARTIDVFQKAGIVARLKSKRPEGFIAGGKKAEAERRRRAKERARTSLRPMVPEKAAKELRAPDPIAEMALLEVE